MLLSILIGVIAIGVLGLVCGWVLKARGGLEAMHHPDADMAARRRADTTANVVRRHDAFGGGGGF